MVSGTPSPPSVNVEKDGLDGELVGYIKDRLLS